MPPVTGRYPLLAASRILVSRTSADAELVDEFVDRLPRNGSNR